jgi:hypothetical protein
VPCPILCQKVGRADTTFLHFAPLIGPSFVTNLTFLLEGYSDTAWEVLVIIPIYEGERGAET